jgi:hypothetical protein
LTSEDQVRDDISQHPTEKRREEAIHEIWTYKKRLREAMRADLGLLFDEDQR